MARGRMINITIAEDTEFNGLSLEAQLVYLRTIPHLDRDGLINGHPSILWGKIAPLMPDLLDTMAGLIDEMVDAGLVVRYTVNKTQILFFKGFTKNQIGMRYEREPASTFPPPPNYSRTNAGLEPSDSTPHADNPPQPPAIIEPPKSPLPPTTGALPREENEHDLPVSQTSGRLPADFRQTSGNEPDESQHIAARGRAGARAEVEVKENKSSYAREPSLAEPQHRNAAAAFSEETTANAPYAEFVKEYQRVWAMLLSGEYHAEKVRGWCDRVPIEAWVYALKECADSHKVGNWKYLERILERVEREGVPEKVNEKVASKEPVRVEFSLGGLFQ